MALTCEEQTDDALLELARRGSERAFMVLFGRHRDVVFRLAWRLTNSESAAEDIAQECFLGLLNRPGLFDPGKGTLRTYLYAAVRNLARRHYWLHEGESDLDDDAAEEPTAVQFLLEKEMSELVCEAVAALPPPQREALILFQYEELPLEQIASILGIDAGAVKSRLHRARERLRKALSPHFQGSMR